MMNDKENQWNKWKILSFRAVFIYFFLRTSLWTFIPFVGTYLYKFYYYPSFLIQNYVFKLHDPYKWEHPLTGSGDTLDDWMLSLAYIIITIIGTTVWTLLDRKSKNHNNLYAALSIGLRYYLALIMFSYGIQKIFLNQMPYPSLSQFYTPLGEFTPMRFTWMYLGYSGPYQFFGGFMETLGGLLLLSRKTLLLGLLILLGVMSNVLLLNLFYGVPVKLYSFFLVLMILFLLLKYRSQLINLILNRPTTAIEINPYFEIKWKRFTRIGLKIAFILYAFVYTLYQDYNYNKEKSERIPISIQGAFDVINFKKNNLEINSAVDTQRWNRIVVSPRYSPNTGRGHITCGTSNFKKVNFTLDSLMQLSIKPQFDTTIMFAGQVNQVNIDSFIWFGVSGKDTLELTLKRNEREFILDKRKFMWVMEQKDFY